MTRRPSLALAVVASAAAAAGIAWLKLQGFLVGHVLLAYLFLPLGGFLLWDGFAALARDPSRPVPRFIRIGIAATFLTIHVRALLFPPRPPGPAPAAPAAADGARRP